MATAFAIFCDTDGSLTFYKRDTVPTVGNTFEGKTITSVYTGFETDVYDPMSGGASAPWVGDSGSVTSVSFADTIAPASTAYWFSMFRNYTTNVTIDFTNLDTTNVTRMDGMFYNSNVTNLNLENFDTSNVTRMDYMFAYCDNLTSLDLSSFNTANVTDMTQMFLGGEGHLLTTIYVSELWSTNSVTNSGYMFSNCFNLVGGNGTAFSSSYIDKTRAVIDGKDNQLGYLTYKKYIPYVDESSGKYKPRIQNNNLDLECILDMILALGLVDAT